MVSYKAHNSLLFAKNINLLKIIVLFINSNKIFQKKKRKFVMNKNLSQITDVVCFAYNRHTSRYRS